jgi:prepilin-type N-terminal cleavage/methylation domain-containing protein
MSEAKHSSAGMTLIETAVVMMVIAILVAAVSTGIVASVGNARDKAALDQLSRLKQAIVGDQPRTVPPGEKSLTRHAYVGDMGGLPATLGALVSQGAATSFTVDSITQMGRGWRGPYVSTSPSDITVDPWGNALVYTIANGTSAVTGAATVATIRSKGADGQSGTSDDHVIEFYQSETLSTLNGYVKDADGLTVPGVSVQLSYATSGSIATASVTTDSTGLYTFNNVPQGLRVIQLSPKLSYVGDSANTSGGSGQTLTFQIQNLARNATSVNSITLTYNSNPPAGYKQVFILKSSNTSPSWNNIKIYDVANTVSGTTVTFTATTVNGTGVIQEPFRLDVSNQVMQVPDAAIGVIGAGGTMTFQFQNFQNSGANQDMTGVTFVATFSDGSTTQLVPVRQ